MSDKPGLAHRFSFPPQQTKPIYTDSHLVHTTWLRQAAIISTLSKDPSTKVGAIVVDRAGRCIGQGYNGFPSGIDDFAYRLEDRELKYKLMVHAEMNAILDVSDKARLKGATLYLNTLLPCCSCTACIIQSGIDSIYVPLAPIPDRWKDDMELAEAMLREACVTLRRVTYQ